jgi:xylulokinase
LDVSSPKALWSEQDPEQWWKQTAKSVQVAREQAGIDRGDIAAVGLTGQMHGLVVLNKEGRVLRPAILWNDQRTGPQCDQIRRRVGRERLIDISGNDALAGFTAPKLLWVAEHEPDVYQQIEHVLLPKDYIRYRLTGEFAMDRAGGSGTILFDLEKRTWSKELCQALDIPLRWLPQTYEGTEVTGVVDARGARATGLRKGTTVVGGGGDQAAQAVGVGAIRPGILALTLGTSGVVFSPTKKPLIDSEGRLHAFCHAVPGCWHLMGVMLSAAGSLTWYRNTTAPDLKFDELVEPAAQVDVGAEGLFFLPYLSGERTPYPDPLAKGCFIGLTTRHTRSHLTRAVLEGVAFGLRDSFGLIQEVGVGKIQEIRLSGGGARSSIWRQIISDVLGVRLVTVNATEGAAFGAALLAGVGVRLYSDVPHAVADTLRTVDETLPDSHRHQAYERYYGIYQDLYPTLQPTFAEIGKVIE